MGLGSEKHKNICPFCGGEGKQYHKTWAMFLYPMLFLDPNFKCTNCKELFNKSHKIGAPLKNKKSHLVSNILKVVIIVFFLWILYSLYSF